MVRRKDLEWDRGWRERGGAGVWLRSVPLGMGMGFELSSRWQGSKSI